MSPALAKGGLVHLQDTCHHAKCYTIMYIIICTYLLNTYLSIYLSIYLSNIHFEWHATLSKWTLVVWNVKKKIWQMAKSFDLCQPARIAQADMVDTFCRNIDSLFHRLLHKCMSRHLEGCNSIVTICFPFPMCFFFSSKLKGDFNVSAPIYSEQKWKRNTYILARK